MGAYTQKQTIDDYLENGGTITIIKPLEKKHKPIPAPKKKVWSAPQQGHDPDICASCANKGHCEHPCGPLKWINGDKPLIEKYLNDPIDQYEIPDYNIILHNLSQSINPPDRIGEIIKVRDYRRRAICAMLAVKIPRQNIAALIGISRQHLVRLINPMLHELKHNAKLNQSHKEKACYK